jgi:hypothetical protein
VTPRALLVAIAVAAAAAAAWASDPAPPTDPVGSIMLAFGEHLESHPLAAAEDLYKLLHQAVYGPGHAIPDRAAAAAYLKSELEGLGPPLDNEPRCEPLGGVPPLVRVNLRPFAAAGGDAEALLDAFVATADEHPPDDATMTTVLDLAARWLPCAGRGALAPELRALAAEMAAEGYPAIHHSDIYREAYQPAYRVLSAELAAAQGWCGESSERSNVQR